MRIGIDLDGTFSTDRYESGGVLRCKLMPGAKETVEKMRAAGHEVIFFTHRSDDLKQETIKWLKDNRIQYDGIIFGKPHFNLYIGNESERFTSWDKVEVIKKEVSFLKTSYQKIIKADKGDLVIIV